MIVSTCGFGSTGSSAVSDYLKECENTKVIDKFEFTLTDCTDGLCDLEYHLMQKNTRQSCSISAFQRFQKLVEEKTKGWSLRTGIPRDEVKRITDDFINGITQVRYIGLSPRIFHGGNQTVNRYFGNGIILKRIVRPLEKRKIIKKNLNIYPYGEVRMAVHPEHFYDEARRFMSRLLSGMGADPDRILVLDQAFSGSDPTRSFPFFDDPYAVIVDRDPRDVYIFAREVLLSRGRFMPTDRVEDFITYYRVIRQGKERLAEEPRCLLLQFEDMVYDYDSTMGRIDSFLNVTNHRRKTVFDPKLSVANTNLIRKFPQYAADVEKIEKELPEYLFDFSRYRGVDNSGKMFFGKSPLNR